MKNILGLDLGPGSIGWAVVEYSRSGEAPETPRAIKAAGVRVLPMDAAELSNFNKGSKQSQTAERTGLRSMRRLLERARLRRERLCRVLRQLGFLPPHFEAALDRYGKFTDERGCPLAWAPAADGGRRFLFETAFDEMVADFRAHAAPGTDVALKLPHDWTLYYLRRKALTREISREELAWVLLSFNQKRGYHRLRGEEEEESKKKKTEERFDEQVVTDVCDTGETFKELKVIIVTLADGTRGKVFRHDVPQWTGRRLSLIVSTELDRDGQPRHDAQLDGPARRFRVPTEDEWDTEWALVKAKAQHDIDKAGTTVGSYIYEKLREEPGRKVRGRLVRTIDRHYYRDEALAILRSQQRFHPELCDATLLEACLDELYPHNPAHRAQARGGGLVRFIVDDVLFYQRPLRSKKSLIADCPYEHYEYADHETGEIKQAGIKCIARSHPLFQEFRLWQFLANLRIYRRRQTDGGVSKTEVDVTAEALPHHEAYACLYDALAGRKEFKQKDVLKQLKLSEKEYRWNYPEEKTYPGNETRHLLLSRLKQAGAPAGWLTAERELALWHLLYSVADPAELEKGLRTFARKHGLDAEATAEAFRRTPPFARDYGSLSAKAIGKILPLMRRGHHWQADAIDTATRCRVEALSTADGCPLPEKAAAALGMLKNADDFQGLPTWLACYAVYGRHSEAGDTERWTSPDDIDRFLAGWRQHALRNPTVETTLLETLRVVRDVWRQEGHIDEIHVETAREMKLTSKERKERTTAILENERTNLRIKALLTAFMNPEFEVENVRPFSPGQQTLLRIFEEAALAGEKELPTDIAETLRKFNESDAAKRPSKAETMRYRLWLEQRYCSPYTGEVIPLSKLFTPAYQIEHVIPQARYFDDSLSNKVICEAEVNQLKGARLAYEFIRECAGQAVTLTGGRVVTISSPAAYEAFVKDHYATLKGKQRKLLMDDIPDGFIQRQLNDTRYITRTILSLLSRIVRTEGENEATSRRVVSTTGGVTDRLKKDWGVHDAWNRLILPRFVRMNEMTHSELYTTRTAGGHLIPHMPLEQQRSFSFKRIDHRHHAMDAIVTACATRSMVNYLNNESGCAGAEATRKDLQRLLCEKEWDAATGRYSWRVRKPWETFTQDVYATLAGIVVSFKQKRRVMTKTTGHYEHYNDEGKKVRLPQTKGDQHVVRKSLHKDTVYGEVNLRRIKTVPLRVAMESPASVVDKDLKHKLQEFTRRGFGRKAIEQYFAANHEAWQDVDLKRIPVYYFTRDTKERYFASRKPLDTSFDRKKIRNEITDTGIQQILLRYLDAMGGNPATAFTPEGIERMNRDITLYTGGKRHQPIRKVRVYEKAEKFAVGTRGNKAEKFVEAAKGTNLYYAIYETREADPESGRTMCKRTYSTIPLRDVVEQQKQGLSPVPPNDKGERPTYVLSPGDLVYLPTAEERERGVISGPLDKGRIYKMVSSNKNQCFFIPQNVASPIVDKEEYSSQNKMERAVTDEMIKESCIPLKTDRLGNILGFKKECNSPEKPSIEQSHD